jgi:hypothetical protein
LVYVQRIQCHWIISEALIDALFEMKDALGEGELHKQKFDMWGGCFNFRAAVGRTRLSTHAWGIAVDINPHLGELGKQSTMPDFIVKAFEDRGFEWGGRWAARPDGMHFQACHGY